MSRRANAPFPGGLPGRSASRRRYEDVANNASDEQDLYDSYGSGGRASASTAAPSSRRPDASIRSTRSTRETNRPPYDEPESSSVPRSRRGVKESRDDTPQRATRSGRSSYDREDRYPEEDMEDEEEPQGPAPGANTTAGFSLWSSVANAIGAFSTTDASRSGDYREPDTPVGSESRITVALKKYYLTSAKSGNDLPDWLFTSDELRAAGVRERAGGGGNRSTRSIPDEPERDRDTGAKPLRRLREEFEASRATSSSNASNPRSAPQQQRAERQAPVPKSSAAARLAASSGRRPPQQKSSSFDDLDDRDANSMDRSDPKARQVYRSQSAGGGGGSGFGDDSRGGRPAALGGSETSASASSSSVRRMPPPGAGFGQRGGAVGLPSGPSRRRS